MQLLSILAPRLRTSASSSRTCPCKGCPPRPVPVLGASDLCGSPGAGAPWREERAEEENPWLWLERYPESLGATEAPPRRSDCERKDWGSCWAGPGWP